MEQSEEQVSVEEDVPRWEDFIMNLDEREVARELALELFIRDAAENWMKMDPEKREYLLELICEA
ncbi:MAG: hypothetical protein PQJ59_08095 [Spirochaetales bacterium]|nr:hypothetical protein [Spirochaetales bacterium]